MATPTDLFGAAYLDAADFRNYADLFGAGMALAKYPDDDVGNNKLQAALAASSRTIDSLCGRSFLPGNISEQHLFDPAVKRISVNSPPVMELVEFKVRTSPGTIMQFQVSDVYVNNQKGYVELSNLAKSEALIADLLQMGLSQPQAEIVYKSYQSVPQKIRLACGYQTAFEINSGFVNSTLPPSFGRLEIGGIKVGNVSKQKFSQDSNVSVNRVAPQLEELLAEFKKLSVA